MATTVNVPDVQGIPPVLFASGAGDAVSLLTQDTFNYFSSVFGPQWGIFSGGVPVVTADTVIAFDYKQDWGLADYPIENGAFASYNKVQIPFDVRLRFAAGGSEAARSALLASVAAIANTLNLYDAATPEVVYPNVCVKHFDFHRTATNGVSLLIVDVWCDEIRQASSSGGFGPTQSASSTPQVNGGTVQPTTPTTTQESQWSVGYQ